MSFFRPLASHWLINWFGALYRYAPSPENDWYMILSSSAWLWMCLYPPSLSPRTTRWLFCIDWCVYLSLCPCPNPLSFITIIMNHPRVTSVCVRASACMYQCLCMYVCIIHKCEFLEPRWLKMKFWNEMKFEWPYHIIMHTRTPGSIYQIDDNNKNTISSQAFLKWIFFEDRKNDAYIEEKNSRGLSVKKKKTWSKKKRLLQLQPINQPINNQPTNRAICNITCVILSQQLQIMIIVQIKMRKKIGIN